MDQAQLIVTGRNGLRGTLAAPPPADPEARVEIRLQDGERITVPAGLLKRAKSGAGYEVPLGADELNANGRQQIVIPVVREELDVQKRTEEREHVTVRVTPKVRTEVVDASVTEEQVEVARVPVNRVVSRAEAVRQEGDVTIVPVYEEVLVVERRLMLKEEIRLTRRRQTRPVHQEVELRAEEVRVERSGGAAGGRQGA